MDDRRAHEDSEGAEPRQKVTEPDQVAQGDAGMPVDALVTFYGPRESAQASYLSCREHRFAMCSRTSLGLASEGWDAMVPEDLWQQVVGALEAKGGGVCVKLSAVRSLLTVTPVLGKGYKPPQKMLRLSARETTEFVPFIEPIPYEPGDHYLIPSDYSSQEKLEKLKEALGYLPQDQESSILNLIRKPRLDLRLQVLEWALESRNARADEAPRRVDAAKRKEDSWLKQLFGCSPGLGWVVATQIVCTLALGALWMRSPARPEAVVTAPNVQSPAATVNARAEVQKAARQLWTAMGSSKRPTVERLYRGHRLSEAENDPLTSPVFAEAVLKAEFLRVKALTDGSSDLDGAGNSNDIHNLRDPNKNLSGPVQDALAYLGCQASSPPQPRIADIEMTGTCGEPGETQKRKITEVLSELARWVSSPPDKAPKTGSAKKKEE